MTQPSKHIRLVILGGSSVGKSSIIKRFLFNTFIEKHRATVEDLFYKEFNLGTMLLKVDFLDTSGQLEFPAMRRLSIANGNAFCLVYGIDDLNSYTITKKCFEEIREIRNDFQEIPIIFTGNKADLPKENHLVSKEEVTEWVYCELPRLRTKVMECSAKNNWNIKELMKQFLSLAKISLPSEESGLRRRSSAHASSVSKFRLNNLTPHIIPELIIDALTNQQGADDNNPITRHLNGYSPSNSPKHLSTCNVDNQHSNSSLNLSSSNTSNNNSSANTSADECGNNNGMMSLGQRLKPRSRSLIRRSSKKVNKVKDLNDPDDCYLQ